MTCGLACAASASSDPAPWFGAAPQAAAIETQRMAAPQGPWAFAERTENLRVITDQA